jgi:hypothetical protein
MAATTTFEGGQQIRYTSLGHFEQAVTTTPVGLPSIPNQERVRRVVIRPLGADVYFTDDGTTPDPGHGMAILTNEVFVYDGRDLVAFKMVSAGLTADVRIIYYGT